MAITAIPMAVAFSMVLLYIIDEKFSDYKWYLWLMYAAEKRDSPSTHNFFGKAFIGLGLANIIVPCIVAYGYSYYSNITIAQFIKSQTGG